MVFFALLLFFIKFILKPYIITRPIVIWKNVVCQYSYFSKRNEQQTYSQKGREHRKKHIMCDVCFACIDCNSNKLYYNGNNVGMGNTMDNAQNSFVKGLLNYMNAENEYHRHSHYNNKWERERKRMSLNHWTGYSSCNHNLSRLCFGVL